MTRSSRQTVIVNDQQAVRPTDTNLPGNTVLIIGQSSKRPGDERPQFGKINQIIADDLFGGITVNPSDLASSSVSDDQKISIAKTLDRNLTWNLNNLQNLFPSNSIPNVSVISVGNYTRATLMIKESVEGYGFDAPTGVDGITNNAIEFYAVEPGDESNYFQISFTEATEDTPRQMGVKYVAPVVGLTGTVNVISDTAIEDTYYFDIEDMTIDEIVTNFNSASNPFSEYVRAEIKYVSSVYTQSNILSSDTTITLDDRYRLQSIDKVTLTTPLTNVSFESGTNFTLETNIKTPVSTDADKVNPLLNSVLRFTHQLSTDTDFRVALETDTSVLGGTEPKESEYYSVVVNVASTYYRDKTTPISLLSDSNGDLMIYADGSSKLIDKDLFTFYSLGNDTDGYTDNKIQFARSVTDGLGVYLPNNYFKMEASSSGGSAPSISGMIDNIAMVFGYEATVDGETSVKYISKGVDLDYIDLDSANDTITVSATDSGGHYGVSSRIVSLAVVSKLASSGKLVLLKEIKLPEYAGIYDTVTIDLSEIETLELLDDTIYGSITL